jgi:FMN phosphatase YigB (HAD superfamily)
MFRAIIFDFYGVWAPDNFALYIDRAAKITPESAAAVNESIQKYFQGLIEIQEVIDGIRYKFHMVGVDINAEDLRLDARNMTPEIIKFLQYLHGHFIKVGILAKLGNQERSLLEQLQKQYDLFDSLTSPDSVGEDLLSQAVFGRALQDIGEPPADCLVVSTSPDYIKFATSIGLQTHTFEGFPKLVETIRAQLEAQPQN